MTDNKKVALNITAALAERVSREAQRIATETATLPSVDLLADRLIQEALDERARRRTPASMDYR